MRGSEHQRTEPDGGPSEGVGAPFLAVDDADRRSCRPEEACLAEGLDGLERPHLRLRDDVLDEEQTSSPGSKTPSSRLPVP